MQRNKTIPIYNLPVDKFEKAEEIFHRETANNLVLQTQYSNKRTKHEKIKYLRFMGYLETPKK